MNALNKQPELPTMKALLAGRPFAALSDQEKQTYGEILARSAQASTQRIVQTLNSETAAR